MDRRFT